MSEEADVNYREEILRLVAEGKIKHTTKYVEKASDEKLEKIYKSYVAKQLDETNEQITNTLITQLYIRTFNVFGISGTKRGIKRRFRKRRTF